MDLINHKFENRCAKVEGNTHEIKKHNTLMETVVINNLKHFVYDDSWKMRCVKKCSFKKETQFRIYKPK